MLRQARDVFGGLPLAVRFAAIFYLIHVFYQPKVAASQIALGLGFIAAAIAWRKADIAFPWHPLYVPLLVYVAASIVSALASTEPLPSLLDVGELFSFFVFPLALALYRREPRLVSWGVGTLLAMAVFRACQGFIQYATVGHLGLEHRITGGTTHVMTYSGILLPVTLVGLVIGIERRRWWVFGSAVITLGALVLTLTRSAWLGFAAGAAAIVLVRRTRWMPLLAAAALIAITLSPMPFFARLVSAFDPARSSNLDRIRMVEAGIEIIADQPLLGVGPGNIKRTYPIYRLPDAPRFRIPHLHNNVVQIWAERGVAALFGYALFVGITLRECLRAVRRRGEAGSWGLAGVATVVGLTVAGLFEYSFGDSEVVMNLLDILAIVTAMQPADAR